MLAELSRELKAHQTVGSGSKKGGQILLGYTVNAPIAAQVAVELPSRASGGRSRVRR